VKRQRQRARERGQGIVEFTLILPLFLLMLVAMIDFGFAFYTNLTVEYASREGARVGAALAAGSSTLPCAQVDSYVMAAVQRVLESAGIGIDLNASGGGGVNWIRIYKSTDAAGGGYTTAGNYNQWTYSAGGGPMVDGRVLDFVGPTEAAASWKACTRNNGANPDSIGVAISYTYAWITPIARITTLIPPFAPLSQLTFVDKTVMALNPTFP
jgi:Flp pilus assembly protein TadG